MRDEAETRDQVWERRTELPLFFASLLFIAGYAVRVLVHEGHELWRDLASIVVLLTWLCFVLDYVVRLVLSRTGPLRFVRRHWLDTLVVLMPTLRPLRMVKVHDAFQARRDRPRRSLYPRVITYAGLSAVLLGFSGALGLYHNERQDPASPIHTFWDSVWCVCQTLTTVGYGDVTPVTPVGRLIAIALMIFGMALLGAVTGSFSSWLIQVFRREDEEGPPEDGRSPGAPL
ncbi:MULTISPECIES: potassium channel family protein [unclassified Streptomyces]|uniref:potassium channel family protein n=1 Tax=unclassified Streptomyces TaxID=2593676 RepID=UPI001BE73BAF|nr:MULTISPECIES: potassium channel family protein [unclassified Streptomyces]MBT2403338.1 potassium channel family protein [Streptomyces sp. ISL-21]MBT2453783.1 potassium channel family protein [Streptomyces sp. ISL-86]MBT2613623.1 potassium channel family protein [Streptomyces sp. ISL-87]